MAWDPTSLLSPVLLLLLASGSWAEDLEFYPAQEGETVSVTCWYDPLYRYNEKIWCKQIESLCHPSVTSVSTGDKKLRFSIQQSSQFNSFTVTMTDLKIDDSGFYRCGIVANNTSVFLRTILLVVSKGSSDVSTPDIFPTTRLTERPILITTKNSPSDTTTTRSLPQSTAAVSSPGPGVTILNGTDAYRSSTSSVIIPVVCGLISKTLVFTVLFIVTQKSFRQQTMKAHNSNS
ncbi:triggering receptor expressed on myeloid cells 1-like isoform X1 [Mus pahari]|uniref:triggering receptor expressed on myeloid cells 1-like isoform X1 n=1 Tax=Mus pahari TaxID=10093 RepID=UPI000A304CF3|nr:triggering receptor expressed on myeloid cells 1-like isoform X1 [Mus pahari]